MAPLQSQSGMVLMAVLIILLLIPATVMLLHQQSSAFSTNIAAESRQVELNYLLDAAVSHAKYFADTNNSCTNFSNLPTTTFGLHSYEATINQNPAFVRQLIMNVKATLNDGATATRSVLHTAYQPEQSGAVRPTADTSTFSDSPIEDASSEVELVVFNDGTNESYALLGFTLGGVIPPETKLVSAMLHLTVDSLVYNGPIIPIDWLGVHAIGRKWKETANWQTHDGNKNWRPLGMGEPIHSDTPVATLAQNPGVEIALDVSSSVKRWLREGDSFYGFLLKAYQSPVTLEVASRNNSDFALRPRLELTYACPCGESCGILPRQKYLDRVEAILDPDTSVRLCNADYDYRGSHGDIRWTFNPWREIGDDADPCTGTLKLDQDPTITDLEAYQLKFTGDSEGLQRDAWLQDATEVIVSFRYRRDGLTNTNQRVHLKASNGGALQTLLSIDGGVTDAEYQTISVDVPADLVGANSSFQLFTENLSDSRFYYIDDFAISFAGTVTPPKNLEVLADSYMKQDKPDDKFSTANPVKLKDKATAANRIVARFTTAGLLDGEIIAGATLRLWVADNASDRDSILKVYALDETWHPSEVTWNDRESTVSAWATPGGTFTVPADPGDTPSYFLPVGTEQLWAEFDVTTFAQQWADFPASNYGLIVTMEDTARGKDIRITSSEAADKSLHPHVTLQ